MRQFLLIALFFLAGSAKADEPRWFPLNMELGCVPLSDLYRAYPELTGKKSPSEFVDALKKVSANARSQPFADLYNSELYRKEHPAGAAGETSAEKSLRKLYTNTNAVMVTWTRNGNDDALVFYTGELCKSIYGKLPQ